MQGHRLCRISIRISLPILACGISLVVCVLGSSNPERYHSSVALWSASRQPYTWNVIT